MSRIIVKQLPKNVTEEKIRKLFGTKGTLTDVQLKYTPDGKFRQFCFIGYQSEEEAQKAIEYFNNSCIQTTRIKVELCSALGAEDKPRSWSKYAKDRKSKPEKEILESEKETKKKDKKKVSKIDEIIGEHKNDPEFQEFVKAHDKSRVLWGNDAEINEGNQSEADESSEEERKKDAICSDDQSKKEKSSVSGITNESNSTEAADETKLAEKPISDMEYMKSLISKSNSDKKHTTKANNTKIDLYTIKIKNVPYKIKRQEILKFFKPLKAHSVRLPTKVHGFCYVGFKSEKDMTKAMLKNKSFIKGKQVFFSDFTEKNKIAKAKLDAEVTTEVQNPKWAMQEDSVHDQENISESGKIFFRNLTYTVTEDDLRKVFEPFGPIAEIHLPVDTTSRQIKGFGTVTYVMPEHAVVAFNKLDGTTFHGRLLHLIPGKSKDNDNELNANTAHLSYKQKKALELKKTAGNAVTWNSLFLGPNAVAEILAKQFEMSKERILDTNQGGSSAAVRLALGETQIVAEMKKFMEEQGVCLNAFEGPPTSSNRSKTIILAKNLPADTTIKELAPLFAKFGPIGRIVLPPSGVTALIEFCDPGEARHAFKKLAYSKFKHLPLYLEWAPENVFKTTFDGKPLIEKTEDVVKTEEEAKVEQEETNVEAPKEEEEAADADDEPEANTTLFLRNLNFKTVQDTVYNHFKHLGTIHTVEIARKKDPKNPGCSTSLGYGFIQFKKQATAETALKRMQITNIDGNAVELKRSDRILKSSINGSTHRRSTNLTKQTSSKILVRNIPFQAKAKEVRDLFKAFGDIRSIRLPLKMIPGEETHRGFGFVDFISKSDAKKAFDVLSQSTHLYGRRLVLEWASTADEDVVEIRKRTAQQFQPSAKSAQSKKKAFYDVETDASVNVAEADGDEGGDSENDL